MEASLKKKQERKRAELEADKLDDARVVREEGELMAQVKAEIQSVHDRADRQRAREAAAGTRGSEYRRGPLRGDRVGQGADREETTITCMPWRQAESTAAPRRNVGSPGAVHIKLSVAAGGANGVDERVT